MDTQTQVDDGVRSGAQPAADEAARQATTYVVLLHVESEEPEGVRWEERGTVTARTRAAALEHLDGALDVTGPARVQLVPERFWQEIRGEVEQPAPRIVWKGV